jgi:hypothetical protein
MPFHGSEESTDRITLCRPCVPFPVNVQHHEIPGERQGDEEDEAWKEIPATTEQRPGAGEPQVQSHRQHRNEETDRAFRQCGQRHADIEEPHAVALTPLSV